MSKYTCELRHIVESENLYPPPDNVLSLKKVLDEYPLYIESYKDVTSGLTINRREELNEKIINHYLFREIAFETVPLFLFHLQRTLNEKMKLYNQRYKSIDLDINPINNVDMTETFTHEITGSGTTIANGSNTGSVTNDETREITGDNLLVDSDTPASQISETDIKNNLYASRTSYDKTTNNQTIGGTQSSTGTNENEINSTDSRLETYTRKESGSSKGYTFAQNIDQWRNIMINVDMEVVNELEKLFMQIW